MRNNILYALPETKLLALFAYSMLAVLTREILLFYCSVAVSIFFVVFWTMIPTRKNWRLSCLNTVVSQHPFHQVLSFRFPLLPSLTLYLGRANKTSVKGIWFCVGCFGCPSSAVLTAVQFVASVGTKCRRVRVDHNIQRSCDALHATVSTLLFIKIFLF